MPDCTSVTINEGKFRSYDNRFVVRFVFLLTIKLAQISGVSGDALADTPFVSVPGAVFVKLALGFALLPPG